MPSFDFLPVVPATGNAGPDVGFAGIDKDRYPGDQVMASLKRNTNLKWTGFYLTPAPSQGHTLGWMGKHGFLRDLGWGIAPIYVGRQVKSIPDSDHRMSAANGTIDGVRAARLASSTGINGTVIYLDFEHGLPLEQDRKQPTVVRDYYAAWADSLRNEGFRPGVYCNSNLATGLAAAVPDGVVWAVNFSKFPRKLFQNPFPAPDPVQSGSTDASVWQLKGNITIEYDDIGGGKKRAFVDLNTSDSADPSSFGRS